MFSIKVTSKYDMIKVNTHFVLDIVLSAFLANFCNNTMSHVLWFLASYM